MEHNELTRVQLPAAVRLTRLGYTYIKKKELRQDKDEETNILINPPLVKSSATSSLITRVPEVKLFGLAQTKYLRFYTCEVV